MRPSKSKIALCSALAVLAAGSAKAELEIGGNVTTVTFYQHDNANAGGTGFGGATQGDLGAVDIANGDHFRFVVDQVELNVENEFGDNIRARADIDFRDVGNTVIRAGDVIDLEQGFVTANIAVGNGMELLVGKFNTPVGLELNDRNENVFSTYTHYWQLMAPTSLTGAKLYYEFNDNWNMDLGVVNNVNGGFASSAVPTSMLRIGAIWGEEGNQSYIHLGGYAGPEGASNGQWTYIGNLWGNWALGDNWDLTWEYNYRQNGAAGADPIAHAGQVYVVYQASDVWTIQARGAALYEQRNGVLPGAGVGTAVKDTIYSGTLGATYAVADDANVKFEYRYDYGNPTGAGNNTQHHTGVVEFGYVF